jgi:integrase
MLRITFQSNRIDKSTGYYIDSTMWDTEHQRVLGFGNDEKELNQWIETTIAKIKFIFSSMCIEGSVCIQRIVEQIFAKAYNEPTLLETIQRHNDKLKQRVNIDFTKSTYEKYIFTHDKIQAFIKHQYQKKDVFLKDLKLQFIKDFDHYLRVIDLNKHNTAVKYCINLKRILNVAVQEGLLTINPFNGHKTTYKITSQVYLYEEEVDKIKNAKLVLDRHKLIRDLFLFQCYTGLAYADLLTLKRSDISIDNEKQSWIIKQRQKTGIPSMIPLTNAALTILNKYMNLNKGFQYVFKGYSIQKYNVGLGEIGQLCRLTKKLSSHVGRRTFGNIALGKGASLNVISKILGHSNTLITQKVYAITTQNIIKQEFRKINL